jgi:hypothetical protein
MFFIMCVLFLLRMISHDSLFPLFRGMVGASTAALHWTAYPKLYRLATFAGAMQRLCSRVLEYVHVHCHQAHER